MKRRFELGMSINYAYDWGIVEGTREFFQNAIDEEKENPENKMSCEYVEEKNTLYIRNKKSSLSTTSLLLGATTKAGVDGLIGRHGEGYKVATVALVRNGVTVRIYNNEAKEVWTSKIVNSKRYQAEIVVFDIESKLFKSDYDLVVELEGITPEDYKTIVESNLMLQDDLGETKEGINGRVLFDSKYKGKIFVSGLYVCANDYVEWGYDFKPELISLDRDRGLIDTFNLKFAISRLINGLSDEQFIIDNIHRKDLEYISSYLHLINSNRSDVSVEQFISDSVYNKFKEEHGEDAIPVNSTEDFNGYSKMGLKPVMVDYQIEKAIKLVDRDFFSNIKKVDLDDAFDIWYSNARYHLPKELASEIRELWSKARES